MNRNSRVQCRHSVKYIWVSFTAMKPPLLLDEKHFILYHFLKIKHIYFSKSFNNDTVGFPLRPKTLIYYTELNEFLTSYYINSLLSNDCL